MRPRRTKSVTSGTEIRDVGRGILAVTVIARSPEGDVAIQGPQPPPFGPWIASSLRSSQ